ncbi:alpha-N-acetylglucosaminidase [Ricinus communis]|uniref:Alpha-N-acetylglucosaminidase n=1 Tax=Ricinus communis TaxID=3988 RepID=B9R8Y6_RICCO|nr:alpha-N-acetylglucosaminidase [Ricinus communis]EEF52063.1 alpha-n-acetylglucosaminidase, putative [Ricinus communis]|eukprot:XP_002511461.1 alpha-N-acetylglucosaminidase [Ricinus communis]
MDSLLPAISVFLLFSIFAFTHSSTIGVGYISRLLEIQERERASPSVQLAAARGVLHRLLPSHSSAFEFRIISKEQCGGQSCFIIENYPFSTGPVTPEIIISGVNGMEVVAGLHWYLKYWCGSHISWDKTGGAQLNSIPKLGSLPHVQDAGVLVLRPIPWNYYQNAVTSSYTFAWWDWKRWEKEIDWMALQGINLPLAFTGQEAIWQKVFKKYNLSKVDLDDFFGGPAFLAWSRMGNLHRWGGSLPQSWFFQQLILQKKILARMYELGMNPVLPAFSGNVPAALRNIFPSAKIARLGNWFSVKSDLRWCCTYLLDATDPLFIEIGRAFIEQQLEEYGSTSHIYNCDTFDENTPPVDDPKYISALGAAVFKGMQSGDNDAVWLMQGWLFSYDPFWRPPQMKALLHSVPVGRLVVLDLFAEVKPIWTSSYQFYGVPYIWCMLHNFAGNVEMYGILDSIASGPVEARTSENSTMVGVGMSMEGIEQNPVVYDLMSEMAFQHKKVDVKAWINLYSTRRYGRSVPSIQDAWDILYHTVYNCTDGAYDKNRDVIVAFPDVNPFYFSVSQKRHHLNGKPVSRRAVLKENSDSYDHPHLWYSTSEVLHALELFITSGEELSGSSTYSYDLVDLTRQALAKYGNELFLKIIESYQANDGNGVASRSQKFLDLVEDMDTLLGCHEGFLLGPWLESAKQLAQDQEQEKQFEWNARTQITMWFDNTEDEASLLHDYGNKYWSGLLQDYYGPRAAIYFKYLIKSLENGKVFPLKDWRREWIKLTNEWQRSRNKFPVKSNGNALIISKWLYDKYLRNPDTTYDH